MFPDQVIRDVVLDLFVSLPVCVYMYVHLQTSIAIYNIHILCGYFLCQALSDDFGIDHLLTLALQPRLTLLGARCLFFSLIYPLHSLKCGLHFMCFNFTMNLCQVT